MNIRHLTELRDIYRSTLLDDVVPFWLKHSLDAENGGYITSLDRDGSRIDSDKGIWIQGRFAWLLAHLHNSVGPNDTWLAASKSGIDFLDQFGTDPKDNLMWFHVTENGLPIRKRRYRFSEAFACIANAAFFEATGEERYAAQATQLFDTFLAHHRDATLSPFPPKFTGTRPSKGIGNPMILVNTAQICRRAGIEGDWDQIISEAIREITIHFVHPDIECVMETVASDGSRIDDHFDGRTLNPGHAIEAGWFILEEAKHRGNDPELITLGCRMLDWMWQRGWDTEYGGMLYFVSVDEKPVQEYWHDMKFWWPHNETIIATLMAYQLTGDDRYATMHQQVHDWSFAHFPDQEHGEWFGYLRRDGAASNPLKGNLWKGPFHLPRMLLKGWQVCDEMLASAKPKSENSSFHS